MTDIEDRLRSAMHAAVDGKEASASELISLVKRRHRRHTIRVACIAVLAALAVAVPAGITMHDRLGAGSSTPPAPGQAPSCEDERAADARGHQLPVPGEHGQGGSLVLDRDAAGREGHRPARLQHWLQIPARLWRLDR